jgi:hypothetical protein
MNESTQNDWLDRLEWSIRALAQPADVQKKLFPQFTCVADELALEFDECYQGFLKSEEYASQEALNEIKKLDSFLEAMSGPTNAELWTDEALFNASQWSKIRDIATKIVLLMGWSISAPSPSGHIYIGCSYN